MTNMQTDPVLPSSAQVQMDFDRIAPLAGDGWNHNSHYHTYLLRRLPDRCAEVLEVGCGTGTFARLLAERTDRVLALDLSPEMVRIAKERSTQHPNIDYQVADARLWPFPYERFDAVTSIATLHHLPLEPMLARMSGALKPGGTLVVLDLFESHGFGDILRSAVALPLSTVWRLYEQGRLRPPKELRDAWDRHCHHDTFLPFSRIRHVCVELLPGAVLRKHLLWRYSLVWQKPLAR